MMGHAAVLLVVCLLLAVFATSSAVETRTKHVKTNKPIENRDEFSRKLECTLKHMDSKNKYMDIENCMRLDGPDDSKNTIEMGKSR